jgi:hypothetical protein
VSKRQEAEKSLTERDRLGLTSGVAVQTEDGRMAGFAFKHEDVAALQKAAPQPPAANEKAQARISVACLYFDRDRAMPGNHYGGVLDCTGSALQKHWRCDYMPRLQFFELTFFPAPGTKEKSVTRLLPREWAAFDPA